MNRVIIKLSVAMKTDRDPFEMGQALAMCLQDVIEHENPDQVGIVDVDVDDAEVVV